MKPERIVETTDGVMEFKIFLMKVLRRWHWVAICVGAAWFIAFLVNRYETPVYESTAAIITKRFEEGSQQFLPEIFQTRKVIQLYAYTVG